MNTQTAQQKAVLLAKAQDLVARQKWRDAISTYKQLLSLESNPLWIQSLLTCYQTRAQELQDKGLHNEAMVLWENCFDYADALTAERALAYLDCAIKAGKPGKAAVFYNANYPLISKHPETRKLESRFAAGLLCRENEVAKAFASDHPLCQQSAKASQALAAYCAGDNAAVDEALKAIPFRSPLKDFVLILKALLQPPPHAEQAREMLNKIPPDSAFSGLAQAVLASVQTDDAVLHHTLKANSEQRALISELKGWNKPQVQLLHELTRLGRRPSDSDMLTLLCTQNLFSQNVLSQKKALINETLLRDACRALIVSVPKGTKVFEKRFGRMNAFEKAHIKALASTKDEDIRERIQHWLDCLNVVSEANLDAFERSALCKHIAKLLDHARWGGLRASITPEQMLRRAIDIDPHDLSSHLDLLKMQADQPTDKEYQTTIDVALDYFPGNRDILMQAVTASQKRKSFKKAAGYAKKLLALDPINKVARKSLVNCHLEHARKQILKKKFDLANKEIALAQQFVNDTDDQLDLATVNAWHAFTQGDNVAGEQAVARAKTLASHPLTADMLLYIEGLRQRIRRAAIRKTLGKLTVQPFKGGSDVQAWCKRLRSEHATASRELADVFIERASEIQQTIAPLKDIADFTLLGDTLHAIEACSLLREVSQRALTAHPAHPLFTFYLIYGMTWGKAQKLTQQQLNSLRALAANDKVKADQRTHHLITQYLDDFFHWINPPDIDFDDDDEDLFEDDLFNDEGMHDNTLFGGVPPPGFIDEMLKELGRVLPKQEFQKLEKGLQSGDPEIQRNLFEILEEFMRLGGSLSPKKKRW